jgi:mRNA interferase MazF
MPPKLRRGEIWLANLNPGKGTEPGKTRPVLIFQDQALLDVEHPSTLIIPLTTTLVEKAAPLRIRVRARKDLEENSDLLIDQIRAIDNRRLKEGPLAFLQDEEIERIEIAIREIMGIESQRILS